MPGKYCVAAIVATVLASLVIVCFVSVPAYAYRVCTFRGTVVDHGWRSMTVRTNGQCAEVNVGWRTKYIPNHRPCIGETVAVDFILEDGYMKATKVVSLSPLPPSQQCYPPAPPASSSCRTVGEEPSTVTDGCPPPRAIISSRPPAHVANPAWSPSAPPAPAAKPPAAPVKKPAPEKREAVKTPPPTPAPETPREETKPPAPPEDKKAKVLSGEVVASSPKSLSLRVLEEGETAEVVNIKVGLKTKFIPFRRPAVGEKVRVEYRQENGDKFGYTVQVIQ